MLLLANAPHKKVLETTKMIKIQYEHLCCMLSIINLLGCCICFIGPPVLPLAISAFMTPVDAESEFDHALVGLNTDNRQHIAVIFVSIGPRLSTNSAVSAAGVQLLMSQRLLGRITMSILLQ